MCKTRMIQSLVFKAAKNIAIWVMKLINASELSIAQKYEEKAKQISLKSCGSKDSTVYEEHVLNSENREQDTYDSRQIADICCLDQNQFDELFENETEEIGKTNDPAVSNASVTSVVSSTSNILTESNILKFLDAPNAPTTSNVPKLLDAPNASTTSIDSKVPKFLEAPIASNAKISSEDQEKLTDLVPISLHNVSSILIQHSKTPKSVPHLIVLRECSSDFDRTSTLPFQVVGEGLNKVFLLSRVKTSSDLQAFCQQFCQSNNLVLYEISDKDIITNEFDAKRLTEKEIKQYCRKFETVSDEEFTCENEEVQIDSSSVIFDVREVGKNEFQKLEVKQNNGKHRFKVKICQPNHDQK